MIWLIVAGVAVAFAFLIWSSRRQASTFRYGGAIYRRRPDGSFVDSLGAPVAGAVLLGALAVAYQEHRRQPTSSSDGGGSDGSDWSSDSDSSSDSGGDSGGGDGGGGGD